MDNFVGIRGLGVIGQYEMGRQTGDFCEYEIQNSENWFFHVYTCLSCNIGKDHYFSLDHYIVRTVPVLYFSSSNLSKLTDVAEEHMYFQG